ncbi:hypothetical protein PVAP13_2KG415905 [Panicum virgatum]|uniref:Uncharacterized protein n=1 Tax=Panicum virgatum TaxID=38727 RepID=A0A8T0WKI1_PANVG|nr:hypothetical protein PVAP13_2KG415905 [Panicum virgatum]
MEEPLDEQPLHQRLLKIHIEVAARSQRPS